MRDIKKAHIPLARLCLGRLLQAAVITCVMSMSAAVHAQAFPTRPVKIILPLPAGLGPDVVMRYMAEKLSKQWGQPVLIDNRPGASGIIAMEAARKGTPDGHDLVCADVGTLTVNRHIYKNLPYLAERDFEPIIPILSAPYFVIASSTLPVKNLREFIVYAKANPQKMSYGSLGVGNTTQLSVEAFKNAYGIEMVHAPFKDLSQMVLAGGNGDISMMMVSTVSAAAGIQTGRLKVLAVGAKARLGSHPDIPTIQEAAGINVETGAWVGCLAVKGTPPQVINKINQDMDAIIKGSDFKGRLFVMGFQATGGPASDLAKSIKVDSERFGQVVQKLNIKPE